MKINKSILKILIITTIIFFLTATIIKPILADPGNGNKDGNSNDPQQTEPKGSNNGNKENNQNKNNEGNGNKGQQQNQGGIEDDDGDQVDDKRERYQNRYMKIIGGKNKTSQSPALAIQPIRLEPGRTGRNAAHPGNHL